MLTERFVAATLTAHKAPQHTSTALKDVGIFLHEFQPRNSLLHGYKKSSSQPGCVAIGETHIFAAQADKAVVHVYSRERGNQEATVPFPDKIRSVAFAAQAAILVLGTEGGQLILWEVATGRLASSAASHLQAVSALCITPNSERIVSGSADSSIHVWSLATLVSFSKPGDQYETATPSNTSLSTFPGHRSAITSIACGHSQLYDNYAVSASNDGTCHIWHLETCQILRTILFPSVALCITLDPADRVLYFGCQGGVLFSWDVFQDAQKSTATSTGPESLPPHQLLAEDAWTAPAADMGDMLCLTLSYDGMSLVSGHQNGAIFRWDAAKHRIVSEVAHVGQPVTNVEMLRPKGLAAKGQFAYVINNIVKPNLGLASETESGSCGVPAVYKLQVSIAAKAPSIDSDSVMQAVQEPGIPSALLDDAWRSLAAGHVEMAPSSNDDEKPRVEKLEDEVAELKEKLAVLQAAERKRWQKKVALHETQDALEETLREAYFSATRQGTDGDLAMANLEKELARPSHQDKGGDEMELG